MIYGSFNISYVEEDTPFVHKSDGFFLGSIYIFKNISTRNENQVIFFNAAEKLSARYFHCIEIG